MLCLQNVLVPLYNNNMTTCSEIESIAFDSHAKCYVDSGLCSLPTDWWTIFRVIDIRDIVHDGLNGFKVSIKGHYNQILNVVYST